jgi:hypothetical protein
VKLRPKVIVDVAGWRLYDDKIATADGYSHDRTRGWRWSWEPSKQAVMRGARRDLMVVTLPQVVTDAYLEWLAGDIVAGP